MTKNITYLVGGVALGALAMYMYNVKTSPASVGSSSPEGEMSEAAGFTRRRIGAQKAGTGTFECECRNRYGGIDIQRSCRTSQHGLNNCQGCCAHYGKEVHDRT